MPMCCSGNHFWYEDRLAFKCCNPEWQEMLLMPEDEMPESSEIICQDDLGLRHIFVSVRVDYDKSD